MDSWTDVTIGGKKIAYISPEELQSRSCKQLDGDVLITNLEMHYNAMFDAESQDGGVIKDELESYIYSCEIDKIKTMRTWTFLQTSFMNRMVQMQRTWQCSRWLERS